MFLTPLNDRLRKYAILTMCLMTMCIECRANGKQLISDILDGRELAKSLCDNFENPNWDINYGNDDYWHDVKDDDHKKIGPESRIRITSPAIGEGALELSRKNDPRQQEILSAPFKISRKDKPIFIVRVYLSSLENWVEYDGFGFRLQTFMKDIHRVIPIAYDDKYSTSIWVKKKDGKINFYFRAANGRNGDEPGGPVVEPGWWTWAIAFDDGVAHYYISKGKSVPTSENHAFDTTQFPPPNNPQMEEIEYAYFAISPNGGNPKFVIDDYEVWIKK